MMEHASQHDRSSIAEVKKGAHLCMIQLARKVH
jgi:hypothetical protein